MDSIINTKLLGHPLNWLIVWSTLAVVGYAMTRIHHGLNDCTCND